MIVFYKNYKRTDRTLLSIQSVRYLFPDIDIRCLFLYDESLDEYIYEHNKEIDLLNKLQVKLYFDKKKWNFNQTSAVGSSNNGYYFTEGINKIQNICRDIDEKVLIVDEDTFFTTGETIKFLLNNDFDLACSYWESPEPVIYNRRPKFEVNGSIICINSKKLNNLFPIIEQAEYIEVLLGHELYEKCIDFEFKVVNIPTRHGKNYFGDGCWTNNIEVIKNELTKANILYE
jgi:hypothetical protein